VRVYIWRVIGFRYTYTLRVRALTLQSARIKVNETTMYLASEIRAYVADNAPDAVTDDDHDEEPDVTLQR